MRYRCHLAGRVVEKHYPGLAARHFHPQLQPVGSHRDNQITVLGLERQIALNNAATEVQPACAGQIVHDVDTIAARERVGVAANPLIMALANPTPEITPELVKGVRNDAIICTGRSDYPNQVKNVLCFPFIFRGALDVGATTITEEMKMAAVRAIAELARAEQSEVAARAYGEKVVSFGPEYLIPNPFDPRLIVKIAPAVA